MHSYPNSTYLDISAPGVALNTKSPFILGRDDALKSGPKSGTVARLAATTMTKDDMAKTPFFEVCHKFNTRLSLNVVTTTGRTQKFFIHSPQRPQVERPAASQSASQKLATPNPLERADTTTVAPHLRQRGAAARSGSNRGPLDQRPGQET